MFKIVETDNYGRDYPNESFVNVPDFRSKVEAEAVANAINAAHCVGDYAPRFWKVVPDDYTLAPVFEP
jgi:hypothetical protein